LLDGVDEGRLSFLGATTQLAPADGPFVIADIGGGSTELVTGELDQRGMAHVLAVRSVDVGCVRVTEQHLHSDPPKAVEIAAARADIRGALKSALDAMAGTRAAQTVVGLAGTVSTVVSIELGLATYDRDRVHHHLLRRAAVEEVCDRLVAVPLAKRREIVGLEEGRADVIVGGCLVLSELYGVLDVDTLLESEADILDGLALSLL
jgi:exopolyphosphatase/guanosine-5'-triphosphate,3'-diphosphate pyrophosphatase